jgi:transposase, IS6 family
MLYTSLVHGARIRREIRLPNRSWRVDETYIKVAGNWPYPHRAVDSAGETIEFTLRLSGI